MNKASFLLLLALFTFVACRPEPPVDGDDLTDITYAPAGYTVDAPNGFPPMEIPADNPMTVQGIKLGRHLFYDPILSLDSTISCSSCHHSDKAFTDGEVFSVGVEGRRAKRNSMSLVNVGYSWIKTREHNFMWDGRFATLEEQALAPVEDFNEMGENWENVEKKLRNHPEYPTLFREAFGIDNTAEITKYLAAKAIAQFERTINSAKSGYDGDRWSNQYMTPAEQRGFELFLGDAAGNPVAKDAECLHCHSFSDNKALFARNNFTNNGLDSVASFSDFVDKGYGATIGDPTQNGFFREVTLRNIALTAPYMHDGRFKTLREVLDHYATGGHAAPNLAPELSTSTSIQTLTEAEKDDLEAFLHALTDTTIVNRAEWQSPF